MYCSNTYFFTQVRRRKARKLRYCGNLLPLVRQAKEARDLRELAEWFLSDDEDEDIQAQENVDSIEVEVNNNIANSNNTNDKPDQLDQ